MYQGFSPNNKKALVFVFYTPLERCRASSSTTLQSYYLKYEDLDVQHVLHIDLSSS